MNPVTRILASFQFASHDLKSDQARSLSCNFDYPKDRVSLAPGLIAPP